MTSNHKTARSRSRRVILPESRNDRGQYEFNCGFAPGKSRGKKFRVNTADEREYQRRRGRISELWDRVVADGQSAWPFLALEIAKAIARGDEHYVLDPRGFHEFFVWRPGQDEQTDPEGWKAAENFQINYVAVINRVGWAYHFPIVRHNPAVYAEGLADARGEAQQISRHAAEAARQEIAELGFVGLDVDVDAILGPSLHDALRVYLEVIAANPGSRAAWKDVESNQVQRLPAHHAEVRRSKTPCSRARIPSRRTSFMHSSRGRVSFARCVRKAGCWESGCSGTRQ